MNEQLRGRPGSSRALAIVSAAALAAAGVAGSAAALRAAPLVPGDTTRAAAAAASPGPTAAMTRLEDLSDAFADVAARIKPSVVYIRAKEAARPVATRGGQGMDQVPPEFRQFFRQFGLPDMPGTPQGPQAPRGGGYASGSGFIVSPDGYILTNNHVVDGASEVMVRLLDRREFKARVVGTDPTTDVAVLKIDARSLPPMALGNSDDSRVGEWVLAIGNPLGEGLTFTVTSLAPSTTWLLVRM